jgi:hypothetical protein
MHICRRVLLYRMSVHWSEHGAKRMNIHRGLWQTEHTRVERRDRTVGLAFLHWKRQVSSGAHMLPLPFRQQDAEQ